MEVAFAFAQPHGLGSITSLEIYLWRLSPLSSLLTIVWHRRIAFRLVMMIVSAHLNDYVTMRALTVGLLSRLIFLRLFLPGDGAG
jgi:hypothetical protein